MPLQSFGSFLGQQRSKVPDISDAVKIGGKLGSNEGGQYLLNGKDHHYVKFYRNPQQAISEVAASHVYEQLGVPTTRPFLVKHKGRIGVASKWQEGMKPVDNNYRSWPEDHKKQLARHFVAAVVTKNWDAVGLVHDNMSWRGDGKLMNNDLGGVFKFRAQGAPKHFGDDIDEFQSLRESGRPSGDAFGHLSEDHINDAIKSLKALDKNKLESHFRSLGLEGAREHAEAIHGRAQRLLRQV